MQLCRPEERLEFWEEDRRHCVNLENLEKNNEIGGR